MVLNRTHKVAFLRKRSASLRPGVIQRTGNGNAPDRRSALPPQASLEAMPSTRCRPNPPRPASDHVRTYFPQ